MCGPLTLMTWGKKDAEKNDKTEKKREPKRDQRELKPAVIHFLFFRPLRLF